ncbi:MAG: hypothetical protein LBT80_06845 [Lactobacillaceae bacterium]|jgi:hypothetical protein|nr:hypothetical protein [Lactobacillaceae bacterium]
MKLTELATLSKGFAATARKSESSNTLYDIKMFDRDLTVVTENPRLHIQQTTVEPSNVTEKVTPGSVVISTNTRKAAVVSELSGTVKLSGHFVLVEFSDETIDSWYFVYLFNENSAVRRQIEKATQGSALVKSINLRDLGGIDIPLVDPALQRQLGETYIKTLHRNALRDAQQQLQTKLTFALIEKELTNA